MYRLDIKYTREYGDTDPSTGQPEITITRDPDKPGTYIYSWQTHYATMNADEINGTLTEICNDISTFEFVVYYGSSCWDVFAPARTAARLWSEKEQRYIFNGRVVNVTQDMEADGTLYKTVQCENELAYLCDSICDVQEVITRLRDRNRSMVARDVLITMLELHHINAESIAATLKKGFMPPNSTWSDENECYVYPSNVYPTTAIDNAISGDVDTTWAMIQDIFVNTLGFDIWVSYNPSAVPEGEDQTWTFGYNVFNMAAPNQHMEYGDDITLTSNMQSLRVEASPTSNGRITRIVPLGGIGQDGKRLDVTSIPQYHEGWVDPSYERAVSNELLSISYGHIDKVTLHEDLVNNGNKTDAEVQAMIQELYRRGRAEADALSGGITSITVDAVDLYELGESNAHKFEVGKYHRITNQFFGLDDTFRLVRKVTDLAEPYNPQLEFAKEQTKSTAMTASRSSSTANRIYNVENMIANRLDMSSIMRTNKTAYEQLVTKNENTVHYVDQGDGTWKAYMGDEPIVGEGGGGVVESAAIVTTNINDFLINQELMMTITPETRLYYGGMPTFVVVQGHYCLALGQSLNANSITYDTTTEKWVIGGNADLYDAILENKEKFGTQLGTADSGGIVYGNLLTSADGVHKYPQNYAAIFLEFTQYSHSTTGWNQRIQGRRLIATNTDPRAEWYDNITHPTATQESTTYTTATLNPRTPDNGANTAWTNTISDWFIVPSLYNINMQTTAGRDYGTVACDQYLFFATADGYDGKYSVTLMTFNGTMLNVPLISAAELAFMQGLYQRSEPQEVTP